MARVVGDTRRVGHFTRVCTEKSKDSVYLKRFRGLRHADGTEFRIDRDELSAVINLLLRAETEMTSPPSS